MPTRYQIIERVSRSVYGEQPTDDANITFNLVNQWLSEAVGVAVTNDWKTNLSIDGVTYINNSFYTTVKGLAITAYEKFIYQLTLPQIPMGLGRNEGVGGLQVVDANGVVYDDCIPLSQNKVGYYRQMRKIPNKTLYYPEGIFLYMVSPLQLNLFTGRVRMVSGGDSTTLDSILNVPDDYLSLITDYCINKLRIERAQPKDATNDGTDRP